MAEANDHQEAMAICGRTKGWKDPGKARGDWKGTSLPELGLPRQFVPKELA